MKNNLIFKAVIFLIFGQHPIFSQATFQVNTYPLNINIGALTINDLNGDGSKDIVSANYGPGNISRILGNGQGGFGSPTSYAGASSCRYLVSLDYTGDGVRDIITSSPSNNSNINTPSWLAFFNGTGSGTFGAALGLTLSTAGERIMKAADVNNDGKEDIVIAEYRATTLAGTPRVSVITLPNNGSVPPPVHYLLSAFPTDICVADLNNDGSKDIIVCIWQTGQIVSLLNNGSGAFGSPSYFTSCTNPIGIAAGDFDGDGNMDIVTGNSLKNYAIHIGQGNGSFNNMSTFTGVSVTEVPATGDFDGDGDVDIAFGSDPYAPGYGVEIVKGNGNGTFGTSLSISTGSFTNRIEAVDLNSDGKLDIVGNEDNKAVVLLNTTIPNPVLVKENDLSSIYLNIISNKSEVLIESNQELELKITDISGQIVLKTKLEPNNDYKVLIHSLNAGIYIVSATNQSATLTRKIMIE